MAHFPGPSAEAINTMDIGLRNLMNKLSEISKVSSALEFRQSSDDVARANTELAKSSIEDTDLTTAVAELTRLQILEQANIAVYAQANLNLKAVLQMFESFASNRSQRAL